LPKLTQSAPTLVSNSPKSNQNNVAHLSLPQAQAPVAKPSRLRIIPTPNVAQASLLESNSNPDDSRDSTKKRNEPKMSSRTNEILPPWYGGDPWNTILPMKKQNKPKFFLWSLCSGLWTVLQNKPKSFYIICAIGVICGFKLQNEPKLTAIPHSNPGSGQNK
jgi:hypothetical protein